MSVISDRILSEFHDKEFRDAYVDARTRDMIAYQIKAVREQRGLSQSAFATLLGKKQSEVSRLEDPDYGRFTVTTLLKIASALDVAFVGKLCSYDDFLRDAADLSPEALGVIPYSENRVASHLGQPTQPQRGLLASTKTHDVWALDPPMVKAKVEDRTPTTQYQIHYLKTA